MRKFKGGMRESKLFDTRIYPVVRLAIKTQAPISTLSKHSQRVSFHDNQVSSVNTITVTLIPLSTKELHQERWGLHVPRTKLSTPLHTKSEGR